MNIRVGNKILQSGQKGVLFQSLRAAVLRPFEFRVKAENQTSLNRGPHATFNTADLDLYPSITTLNKVPTSRKWKKAVQGWFVAAASGMWPLFVYFVLLFSLFITFHDFKCYYIFCKTMSCHCYELLFLLFWFMDCKILLIISITFGIDLGMYL